VPLLAGWNSAEIKTPPTTVAAFTSRLRERFGSDFDAALALYPAGSDAEASASAVALASDGFIAYGTWKWIESQAAAGAPVFRYLFDQRTPAASGEPAPGDPGAAHASDIEFVFDTLDSRPGVPWRAEDRAVAKTMGDYWTRFAKTGDPNGPGLPAWPGWTSDGYGRLLRINANTAAETEQHRDRCQFLDRLEQGRHAR
jgi:para-nitrobenzyl esterase